MKQMRGGIWASFVLIACGLGACFSPSSEETPEPDPNFIETNLTEPVAVIESFSKAFTKRNYEAYAALLDADFEFCPLARDAEDFPWLGALCWDRATELEIIANMFDPNYTGLGHPVLRGSDLQCTVLSQRLVGGAFELLCSATFRVMTSESDAILSIRD